MEMGEVDRGREEEEDHIHLFDSYYNPPRTVLIFREPYFSMCTSVDSMIQKPIIKCYGVLSRFFWSIINLC